MSKAEYNDERARAISEVADAIDGLSSTFFEVFASVEVGRALDAISRVNDTNGDIASAISSISDSLNDLNNICTDICTDKLHMKKTYERW